jgi:uncharacterized protein (TIGR02646 family)
MADVTEVLARMSGRRLRCMYCVDSEASDVEHFRPKRRYPKHMFAWRNLLLCCTPCGRRKGDRFPMQGARALLIDPTREDPWAHLTFDPVLGNLTARYLADGQPSAKGEATVVLLGLDRREALSEGYLRSFRRMARLVADELASPALADVDLVERLVELDDHGLLPWCVHHDGQGEPPFDQLRADRPQVWRRLGRRLR